MTGTAMIGTTVSHCGIIEKLRGGGMRVVYKAEVAELGQIRLPRASPPFFACCHDSRCHLALHKDSPETREVQLPDNGIAVEIPRVTRPHHPVERSVEPVEPGTGRLP